MDSALLVTQRANGKWVLPGGTLKPNENRQSALERELMEECGAAVNSFQPFAMYRTLTSPIYIRVVSLVEATTVAKAADPDGVNGIAAVRCCTAEEAQSLLRTNIPHFAAAYNVADSLRRASRCR